MVVKKIIATTDESLYFKDTNKNPKQYMGSYISMSLGENLPQPSQQFIQKYIGEYNKGNIITDVLVEYNDTSKNEFPAFWFTCLVKNQSKDNSLNICFID